MNYKKLQEAVQDEARAEWKRLHHNASIARFYPKLRNEYEYSMFNDCLGDYCAQLIEDLESHGKEETGHSLKFYQYGRQGATVAPHEWMSAAPCSSMGGLKDGVLSWDEGREATRDDIRVLRALRIINSTARAYASGVGEWWADMVEGNEWAEKIAAMDGKREKTITVWR